MKKRLAVFDIDGTVVRYSLFVELFTELVRRGIFPKEAEKEIEKEYGDWVNRRDTFDNFTNAIVVSFFKYIVGVSEKEVEKISKEVAESNKEKVYKFTRDLIRKLKSEDYYLLAISGSGQSIINHFATFHQFDHFIGSNYVVVNGKYTGEVAVDSSSKKDILLKEFLGNSVEEFDLENSVGVGDTANDVSFLDMVGSPIAFNPSMELASIAKERRWKIIVERKDVIYDLKEFGFLNGEQIILP